jgi:hypothetical protein
VGELYSLERYAAYKALMIDGPEVLPLGDFSPMGLRQPAYLDALLATGAEEQARADLLELELAPWMLDADFRVLLVVVDEPGNGWTQRWLTDADWRFRAEKLPQGSGQTPTRRWVTVQFWTHTAPTNAYRRSQVWSAVRRAAWQAVHGLPATLEQMLAQEGAAMAWGDGQMNGEPLELELDEMTYSRAVLAPLRDSTDWPTCFAALYGDEAAREVGYPVLGLPPLAGFALAVYEAISGGSAAAL